MELMIGLAIASAKSSILVIRKYENTNVLRTFKRQVSFNQHHIEFSSGSGVSGRLSWYHLLYDKISRHLWEISFFLISCKFSRFSIDFVFSFAQTRLLFVQFLFFYIFLKFLYLEFTRRNEPTKPHYTSSVLIFLGRRWIAWATNFHFEFDNWMIPEIKVRRPWV